MINFKIYWLQFSWNKHDKYLILNSANMNFENIRPYYILLRTSKTFCLIIFPFQHNLFSNFILFIRKSFLTYKYNLCVKKNMRIKKESKENFLS